MKKSLIGLSVLITLTGCSNLLSQLKLPDLPETTRLCLTPRGVYHKCGSEQALSTYTNKRRKIYTETTDDGSGNNSGSSGETFSVKHHVKLEEYIEQMVMEMQMTISAHQVQYPIAVASFVELDTDFNITNQLGQELSESFITELMKANFPLAEHRATGEILMTQDGDFVLSRNPHQVKEEQKIGYVLSGTLTKRRNGILVNARIVGLKSNTILASSSQLIPKIILTGY